MGAMVDSFSMFQKQRMKRNGVRTSLKPSLTMLSLSPFLWNGNRAVTRLGLKPNAIEKET